MNQRIRKKPTCKKCGLFKQGHPKNYCPKDSQNLNEEEKEKKKKELDEKKKKKEEIKKKKAERQEKFTIRKRSLKTFVRNPKLIEKIQEITITTNEIIQQAYLLLSYFIIEKLKNNQEIKELNQTFLNQFIYQVTTCKSSKVKPDEEIEPIYNKYFESNKKLSRETIGDVLNEETKKMEVAIKNNITMYYHKRYYKYIYFKLMLQNHGHTNKHALSKQQKEDLRKAVNLIKLEKAEELPCTWEQLNEELNQNPEVFLESMFQFNLFFEKHGLKTFSLLPLRRSSIPKNITITSATLIGLYKLLPEGKNIIEDYETVKNQSKINMKRELQEEEEKENKRRKIEGKKIIFFLFLIF